MRSSLRTLLIVMLIMGPLSALAWTKYQAWREEQERLTIEAQRWVWRNGVLSKAVLSIPVPAPTSNQPLSDEELQILNAKMQEAQQQAIIDLTFERDRVVIVAEKDRLAKMIYSRSGPVRKEREK